MGYSRSDNIQFMADYTTEEAFVRLHTDLPLPWAERFEVQAMLDGGEYGLAQEYLAARASDRDREVIGLFFAALLEAKG